jgi:hypothetical protein
MSTASSITPRARQAVRRILSAIDNALAAARELEQARSDLDHAAADDPPPLRIATPPEEEGSTHAPE